MIDITGTIMSKDTPVVSIENGSVIDFDETLAPLYFLHFRDFEKWLSSRAIDRHRTNSRLLKKALRLHTNSDAQCSLSVNAATITDTYWFKPEGSKLCYQNVVFKENHFYSLALRGDPDGFSQKPSRTPELTNIGSFEKCWRLIDNHWWMYKSGNANEYFSELFVSRLGEKLGLDMVRYEMDESYITSPDFTNGASVNYEPISSIVGENDDYAVCFRALYDLSEELAKQYLQLIWTDSICYNMDRHTSNFGLIRNVETGEILSLAPNFDNNIALISRGYPSDVTREKDGLISFFEEFLSSVPEAVGLLRKMKMPVVCEETVQEAIHEVEMELGVNIDREYLRSYILNGYHRVSRVISRAIGRDWSKER